MTRTVDLALLPEFIRFLEGARLRPAGKAPIVKVTGTGSGASRSPG